MSKLRPHVNIDEISTSFRCGFLFNLDGRIIDVKLMYIFDIILMDERILTQLERASLDVFLKDKKSWSV